MKKGKYKEVVAMEYECKTIDDKRIVKIKCTAKNYLEEGLDKYIRTAFRMMPNKIIIEIDNIQKNVNKA